MNPLAAAPPFALLCLEPLRAVLEFSASHFTRHDDCPAGDGHPVILFPGLAADRGTLLPLRNWCERLGYDAHDWGRGMNTGPQGGLDDWLQQLCEDVLTHTRRAGRRASLIGWSLGGIYAREVAKMVPHAVRQVITLGSPFAAGHGNAGWLHHLLSGQSAFVEAVLSERLRTPPPLPCTSIYSRTDGVVAWQSCIEPDLPLCESIEVNDASHMGLVWNSRVWSVVAERLSQREGQWRPYPQAVQRGADDAPRTGLPDAWMFNFN
ncbi:alpha/beta hydrolase [Aquabacterium sp. A7-Y]|uniref:esterase/lipase family protein n=1 Tax=Aquabacterium sp. A7-Y TaxID=1349605 RepID=UPI00223CB612|nr:alpha/beta hydrolase [Aquabacterium sp. A7-Y]MCW7539239.1 alpha/beta hydrolase [Aquabacterium sp. A7-Y]